MGSIMSRLVQIEEKQTEGMKDLHNYLKSRIKGAMQKLREYLKSDDVRARFTTWTLDDVPKAESSWEVSNSNITKALENRLREIIEHWEEDHQVFSNARKSLLQHFQQRYNFVEGQLQNLQVAVTNDDPDVPESMPADGGLTTAEKVVIGVTSPLWVPLTLFVLVICAPVIGRVAIKNKVEDKWRIKEYERDQCAFMLKTSANYLRYATKERELKSLVKDQLKEAELCLKQIEARIPELIEADKRFYRQLSDERRSKKEIKELYQPIVNEASDIRGHLAAFQKIRSTDISSDELDWREDISCRIGSGAFATVYQGKMRRRGQEETVALKLSSEVLDTANAGLIIAKVYLLRKLDHPHIVKFYGTSLLKKAGTTRMILVMEKCKGNLKSQSFDHPEAAPARNRNPDVFREVCRWAKEITDALAFMHKQGVFHRDLTLDNILLSEDNSVRITDVAVPNDVKNITGSLAGTPVYIAPEVFHSKLYDSKANIYSFGIMLWEMWYGRQAFVEFNGTKTPLFNFVDEDHHQKDMKGSKEPPTRWKQLMSRCWDGNPRERPSAKICFQEITAILSDNIV